MEVEIVSDKFNKYLDRREIVIRINHLSEPTPSRVDILKYVVERLSLNHENTILIYIKTLYGENRSEALIYYYPNGIDWSTIEPAKRKKVIKIGEEESKEKGEEA